jgi:hypothetical protein
VRQYPVLNLGAGVQSTTLFELMRQGIISIAPNWVAVFADTQEEPDAVYEHLARLQAEEPGRIFIGTAGKLGDNLIHGRNSARRFVTIPAFTTNCRTESGSNNEPVPTPVAEKITVGMTRRQCTRAYKIDVIERIIRHTIIGLPKGHALNRDTEVHQYIGISRDEARRAVNVKANIERRRGWFAHFPLLEMGWTRADCLRWLQTNFPHPVPRSACVFCPFHSDAEWLRIKRHDAKGWARAIEIDTALRTPGSVVNRGMNMRLYLHRSCNLGFALECEGMCGV